MQERFRISSWGMKHQNIQFCFIVAKWSPQPTWQFDHKQLWWSIFHIYFLADGKHREVLPYRFLPNIWLVNAWLLVEHTGSDKWWLLLLHCLWKHTLDSSQNKQKYEQSTVHLTIIIFLHRLYKKLESSRDLCFAEIIVHRHPKLQSVQCFFKELYIITWGAQTFVWVVPVTNQQCKLVSCCKIKVDHKMKIKIKLLRGATWCCGWNFDHFVKTELNTLLKKH